MAASAHAPHMPTVFLSLGSNIGNREAHLRAALAALPPAAICVKQVSSFYESEPVDYIDQPWFLNCAVEAKTELDPHALLGALHSIASHLGGRKEFSKGPRKIDLDILLYGDESIDTPDLQIPHPRMLSRRFVLTPLAEIAPALRHPSWQANAAQLLAESTDQSQVRRVTTHL